MAHAEIAATIHSTPGTPSFQERRANFEDRSLPLPGSLMVQDLEHDLLLRPGEVDADNTETMEPSVVSPNSMSGAAGSK